MGAACELDIEGIPTGPVRYDEEVGRRNYLQIYIPADQRDETQATISAHSALYQDPIVRVPPSDRDVGSASILHPSSEPSPWIQKNGEPGVAFTCGCFWRI